MSQVRVKLPTHLRRLANVDGEVLLDVAAPVTLGAVLDALEARHPVLRGTIRDHETHRRRAFVRFFACEQDLSHQPPDAPLPELTARGEEPLLVVGAWRAAELNWPIGVGRLGGRSAHPITCGAPRWVGGVGRVDRHGRAGGVRPVRRGNPGRSREPVAGRRPAPRPARRRPGTTPRPSPECPPLRDRTELIQECADGLHAVHVDAGGQVDGGSSRVGSRLDGVTLAGWASGRATWTSPFPPVFVSRPACRRWCFRSVRRPSCRRGEVSAKPGEGQNRHRFLPPAHLQDHAAAKRAT
jgi:sulfur-carrier protein